MRNQVQDRSRRASAQAECHELQAVWVLGMLLIHEVFFLSPCLY